MYTKDLPIYVLNYAIPSKEAIVDYSSGLRPYREGGIRMELQVVYNIIVYHNYGHGGGGVSLAYGCVKNVMENLFYKQNVDLEEEIVVLGAGIIGLTTAYFLSLKGYRVRVVADLFCCQRNSAEPYITTTVAAGYWMPLKIGDKAKTEPYAIATWNHYAAIDAKQKLYGKKLGVTLTKIYSVNDDEQLTYMPIKEIIEPVDCLITFGDGQKYPAVTFETYIIELAKYIPYLMEEMYKTKRLTIQKMTLNSLEDVMKLNKKHIFNCLGLLSNNIFPDPNLNKGIKGHLLKFELDRYPQVSDFVLFFKTSNQRWILQIPHVQTNKLVLGISYEYNKTDPYPYYKYLDKILNNSRYLFLEIKYRTIQARL